MSWTPIDAPYPPSSPRSVWTQDALTCYQLERCCQICPINKMMGLEFPGGCKMPLAVQGLLDREVEMPKRNRDSCKN